MGKPQQLDGCALEAVWVSRGCKPLFLMGILAAPNGPHGA
jgi:hypothetical protein